ncbi:hypothetical protein [Algoriphagus sp.]|uniref:hypothetical protein n=1 Tax=Algoriphagus sp. TaxID=1872435 RepID=UPI003F725C50
MKKIVVKPSAQFRKNTTSAVFREIKKDEAKLKEKINSLLEDNRFEKLLSAELVGIFEQYISKE